MAIPVDPPPVSLQAPRPFGATDRVCLIVPLQDEALSVEPLLRSIAAQSRPPAEIILVDAGSQDDTASRARAVASSFGLAIRLENVGRVHPGTARNHGARLASTGWLAFTDGGVVLDPHWLEELTRAATGNTEAVFGDFEPVCCDLFRQAAACAYVPPRGRTGTRGPTAVSFLVRADLFSRLGGFPPFRAAEDLAFFERLSQAGSAITYSPRAVAHWEIPGTMRGLFSRFCQYSFHNLRAGRGRGWHLGTARLYVALTGIIVLAYTAGAGAWTALGVPAFFSARALRAGWAKRSSFEFSTLHPLLLVITSAILAVIDIATLAGSLRWIREGLPRDHSAEG